VITATNVDVERAVQQGRLRQDLYYRLNIVTLALPPLRNRTEDVLVLAYHFLQRYNTLYQKRVQGFTSAAQRRLLLHGWPGNVRELEHLVARAIALSNETLLDTNDLALPGEVEHPASFREAKARVVQEFERTYLESLLLACQGNISQAAEVARKDRRAFWELLRKHRIDVRSFRELPATTRPQALAVRGAT
jgi:two-component system response regulator GlrR